jgi:hypothetical protein
MTTPSLRPTPLWAYAAGLGLLVVASQLAPRPALAVPLAGEPVEAGTPASATAASAPSEAKAWAATAELYGFMPIRMTGTTTVRGFSADTDLWLGETIPLIQMVGSGRASLEYGRIGFLVDASYTQLGDQASKTTEDGSFTGSAQVTAIQGVYDLALRYRFGDPETAVAHPGSYSVIPYAGVRLLHSELGVKAQLRDNSGSGWYWQGEGNLNRTWTQALVGTQASVFLTPRLRAFARGDIGGFGLGGAEDLSGNAQVGLGYAVGNSTQVNLSWRYLGIRFNNGGSPANGFNTEQNGIEAGLKFFF